MGNFICIKTKNGKALQEECKSECDNTDCKLRGCINPNGHIINIHSDYYDNFMIGQFYNENEFEIHFNDRYKVAIPKI